MSFPYDEIRSAYIAHTDPAAMSWEALVGWHLANPRGHVIKDPSFFVMARAVDLNAGEEAVLDLTHDFDPQFCDAWFLYAFAGDKQKAWRALPFELPWLCFQRLCSPGNELHYLRTRSIRRFTNGL